VTAEQIFKYALATVRHRRLLLCRPHAFPDLIMPGGIREEGEDHVTGLRREIKEELGDHAEVVTTSLQFLGHFEDVAAGRVNTRVAMDVYLGDVTGQLVASSEILELIWFQRDDDPRLLSAIVRNQVIPSLVERGLM
jgi:8-oxo-dGTP diphosphatase